MGLFGNGITTNKNVGINTVCCMTSNGVWTCPAGAVQVEFYVVGAGGGGGGAGQRGVVNTFASGGGGGGGGGVSSCVISYNGPIPTSAAVVIGAGGFGGTGGCQGGPNTGTNGGNGGFTCINGVVYAGGGGGGGGGTCQCAAISCGLPGPGGTGNLRTGGTGGLARFFANSPGNMDSCPGLGGGSIGPGGGGGGAGWGSFSGVTCSGIPGGPGAGQAAYGFYLGQGPTGACVSVVGGNGQVYGAGAAGGGSCAASGIQQAKKGMVEFRVEKGRKKVPGTRGFLSGKHKDYMDI